MTVEQLIDSFKNLKALVIGDVMIDSYIFGKVDRISPEAPVPVVHITRREARPGGAANVAINIRALGAKPILCSVTGLDENGTKFISLLNDMNIDSKGIMQSDEHKTTIKTRVIGNNHQLLRVDDETPFNLSGLRQKEFIHHCLELIRNEKPHVIIFEDYDKGVITPEVIASVTGEAQKLNIPVTVDPKRKNFNHYSNITLFKPNLHELNTGLGIIIEKPDHEVLRDVLSQMISERNMKMIMVTLSEAGVFVTDGDNDALIPAHVRSISDVSGAGDTVISVASLCLAAGTNARTMAALANLAGGLVCEEVGVVPVNRERLIAEAKNDPGIQL